MIIVCSHDPAPLCQDNILGRHGKPIHIRLEIQSGVHSSARSTMILFLGPGRVLRRGCIFATTFSTSGSQIVLAGDLM